MERSESEPTAAEILPTVKASLGANEDRWERSVAAILHGVALLDADGNDTEAQNATTRTEIRKSLETLKETLTPAIYQKGKFYRFTWRQQKLLFQIGETGDFVKACALSGIEQRSAANFLNSARFREYFEERVKESAIRRGWTVDHWMSALDDVWEGRVIKSREQMEAIKELGARIAPKIERIQHEFDSAEFEFTTRDQ